MPDSVGPVDRGDLLQSLTDKILTEIPLTGGIGLENGLGGFRFADRHEPNLVRRSARVSGCFRQQILDLSKVFRDFYHVLLPMLRYTK